MSLDLTDRSLQLPNFAVGWVRGRSANGYYAVGAGERGDCMVALDGFNAQLFVELPSEASWLKAVENRISLDRRESSRLL